MVLWLLPITQWNIFRLHTCLNMYQDFILVYGHLIFQCMDIYHCIYPFIPSWTFGSFSSLGYYEEWNHKHVHRYFLISLTSICLGVDLLSHITILYLRFWRTCRLLSKVVIAFYFPTFPQMFAWMTPSLPSLKENLNPYRQFLWLPYVISHFLSVSFSCCLGHHGPCPHAIYLNVGSVYVFHLRCYLEEGRNVFWIFFLLPYFQILYNYMA